MSRQIERQRKGLSRQQRRALQRAKSVESARLREVVSASATPSWHGGIRSGIRLVLGSPIVALVVGLATTLTTVAFSVAGVVTLFLTHVFISLAFVLTAVGLAGFDWFWFSKLRFGMLSFSLLATATVFSEIDRYIVYNAPEDPYSGLLVAGTEPIKVGNQCVDNHPAAQAVVYLGSTTIIIDSFPHTIIMMKSRDILSLSRGSNGETFVHAEIFDPNGRIIALIEKNEFRINQNNVYYKYRPSKNSLVIYDQHNEKVLDMIYINKKEISITGTLYYFYGVKITDDALRIGNGTTVRDSCFSVGTDIVIN